LILAELKKLRSEKVGWSAEKIGLEGQITVLTRRVVVEIERGDFFKTAALTAQKVDTNSQKMDSNSTIIQTTLETRIAEKNDRIAELTDNLRTCQNNQKWIAAVSGGVGAFAGYYIRGRTNSLTNFTMPSLGLYRLETPRPNILKRP